MTYLEQLLAPDEQVRFATRQHWIVLLRHTLRHLALTTGSIVGLAMLSWGLRSLDRSPVGPAATFGEPLAFLNQQLQRVLPMVELAVVTIGSGVLLWAVLVWTTLQCVVTNRRVVHVRGVINKQTLDSSLEMINDIGLRQSWLGRVFDYGDIEIMTASETGINVLPALAQPLVFKHALSQARRSNRQQAPAPAMLPSETLMPPATVVLGHLHDLQRWKVLSADEVRRLAEQVATRTQADGMLGTTDGLDTSLAHPW